MKHYFSVFTDQPIVFTIILFLAIFFLMLPIASSAGNKTNAGDELISLTVKDELLGDVLKKISMATGYEISLDNKWQSHLVTATLEKVSLYKGLKRILRNLNNVIIYDSDKKIQIIIYDKTAAEGVSSAPSTDKSFNRTPEPRLPASQVLEKEDSAGTEEKPSDNPVVSGQE
jgi:type II secretory pathway component GspD/PulD (secretin)